MFFFFWYFPLVIKSIEDEVEYVVWSSEKVIIGT